jgi:hypothetical protein
MPVQIVGKGIVEKNTVGSQAEGILKVGIGMIRVVLFKV